jgi:hypothetical protein
VHQLHGGLHLSERRSADSNERDVSCWALRTERQRRLQ